jgi:hypothetical protein
LSIESKGLNCNYGSFQVCGATGNPSFATNVQATNNQIDDQTTNQTKQQLEQDALLPLLSSIHQFNETCNTF